MEQIDLTAFLQREGPVTWLFTGDSITQGAKHTRGWRSYTELFKERLNELARNQDVVINTGVGGASVGILRDSGLEERVLRFQPDVLFLMFGTNDAVGGREGVQIFVERYTEVLNRLRNAPIGRIIIQTTVPMMPIEPQPAVEMLHLADETLKANKLQGFYQRRAFIPEYAELTCRIAEGGNVSCIDHYEAWQLANHQRYQGQLMDGGFHPNEYGHRLIAHTIFRACGLWDKASWMCRLFVPVEGT